MTSNLYACVHADEFPAQALLRLRTDLHAQAVAIMEGRAPLEKVCSINRQARLKGVGLGMTRLEAESVGGVHLLARSEETEAAARAVLHECAAQFSPRMEFVSRGTACACVLDITGTERLFGPAERLAERLRAALSAAGLRVSVVVSANFDAARMKAAALQGARGVTVIAAGEEPSALSKLPLSVLELDEDFAQTFAIWGIYTLGELAALPESDLVARLGPRAREWRNLARGVAQHTLQPVEAELTLKEFCAFETAVEQIDSLLLMGARMIDCLATRAAGHALALASLSVEMQLEGGKIARRSIRPALATVDRKFLLKLLQLEIAAHPPEAAVMSLTVSAEPGQSKKVQLGLFAPQTPEPSRLDVTLARLMTIAGEDRVGSPVLEDSHRAGSFRMERFAVGDDARKSLSNKNGAKKSEAGLAHPHMALRRVRPAAAVRVEMDARGPVYFSDREHGYRVTAAYGPWKSSGCWWSTESWNTEEWDVLAESSNGNGLACLLVHDCVRNRWQLEAYYD